MAWTTMQVDIRAWVMTALVGIFQASLKVQPCRCCYDLWVLSLCKRRRATTSQIMMSSEPQDPPQEQSRGSHSGLDRPALDSTGYVAEYVNCSCNISEPTKIRLCCILPTKGASGQESGKALNQKTRTLHLEKNK